MNLIDQLSLDEGVRSKPYVDTVGKVTIGVGRNLTDVGLSNDEIQYLLANDIKRATDDLRSHLPWTDKLDGSRLDALRNMCFNMGIVRLMGFHSMLSALQASAWQVAHDQALNSAWAKQVGARADRIATTFLTGVPS